jgi:GTP-binding protein Era
MDKIYPPYAGIGTARLDCIVTVVDALRMKDEFAGGLDLLKQNIEEEDIENLVIQQIEFCNIVLLNKAREVSPEELERLSQIVRALLPKAEILPISAKNKFGTDLLLKRIRELLPESPAYFDKDQLTDKPARFFVSEIIREKILLYYDKEIPYSVEVSVERFKEDEKHIHINAIIYVERDSQKGIIIGHQGVALKKVSTEARKALEKFFAKPIYLEVFVKVDKDWRSNERELNHFGYNPE